MKLVLHLKKVFMKKNLNIHHIGLLMTLLIMFKIIISMFQISLVKKKLIAFSRIVKLQKKKKDLIYQ